MNSGFEKVLKALWLFLSSTSFCILFFYLVSSRYAIAWEAFWKINDCSCQCFLLNSTCSFMNIWAASHFLWPSCFWRRHENSFMQINFYSCKFYTLPGELLCESCIYLSISILKVKFFLLSLVFIVDSLKLLQDLHF